MTVIPEGYGQINYIFRGTNLPTGGQITQGFQILGTEDDPAVYAADAEAAFAPVVALMNNNTALDRVLVKLGPNEFGPSAEVASSAEGIDSSEAAPPGASLLVRKRTSFGGRTGRGRFYLPGLSEDEIDSAGTIGGTTVSDFQSAIDTWAAALVTAEMSPVVLHGPDSPVTIPHTIVGFEVDTKLATQRRRLRR